MADLHKLALSSSDGKSQGTTLTLDGQELRGVTAFTVHCRAPGVTSAVIEFDMVCVEFDGMADVVASLVQEEAAELTEAASVQRVDVCPGDRFVVTFGSDFTSVTEADAATVKQRVAAALGVETDRVLVLAGVSLSVLSQDGDAK